MPKYLSKKEKIINLEADLQRALNNEDYYYNKYTTGRYHNPKYYDAMNTWHEVVLKIEKQLEEVK